MKHARKLLALLLVLAIGFGLSVPASAKGEDLPTQLFYLSAAVPAILLTVILWPIVYPVSILLAGINWLTQGEFALPGWNITESHLQR